MRPRSAATAFVSLVGLLLLVTTSVAGPAVAATGMSISGRVTSAVDGLPLGANQVEVEYLQGQGGTEPPASVTNVPLEGAPYVLAAADGTYTIQNVTADGYLLYFKYIGTDDYAGNWYRGTTNSGGVPIYPSGAMTGADNTMKKYSTVSGEVDLGAAGNAAPAGSAQVSYQQCEGSFSTGVDSGTVSVGAGGLYTIPHFPPGACGLHVSYSGSAYQGQVITTGLPNGGDQPTTLNVVLTPSDTISGQVSLGSTAVNAGAGDVLVSLEYYNSLGTWVSVAGAPASTDATGHYTFAGLSDGQYRETFTYQRGTSFVQLTHGAAFNVAGNVTQNATIPAALTVSGHVYLGTTATSASAGQVRVSVTRDDLFGQDPVGTVQPVYTALTTASGDFTVTGVAPNSFYIVSFAYLATTGDFLPASQAPINLTTTSQSGVLQTLAQGNEISGTVSSTTDPTKAAAVTVRADTIDATTGNLTTIASTRTRSDGTYELKDIPLGSYEVDFIPDDPSYAVEEYDSQSFYYQPDLVVVSGGLVSGIDGEVEPGATVSGTISGSGLATSDITSGYVGIDIEVYDTGSRSWTDTGDTFSYPPSAEGGINADGTFTIRGLYPDQYRLLAYYDGPRGYVERESVTVDAVSGGSIAQNLTLPIILSLPSGPPIGSLDSAFPLPNGTRTSGDILVQGWAVDPKTTLPITVRAYVDGKYAEGDTADYSRPDIANAFAGYGDAHGYAIDLPTLSPGSHTVCVYAINSDPAKANTTLGCKPVTIHSSPFGSFDSVTTGPGYVTVRGWEIDPATSGPANMKLIGQVDHVGQDWDLNFVADQPRPDIGAAYPGYGSAHGFVATDTKVLTGSRQVCLQPFPIPANNNTLVCKTINVPVASPFGSLDSVVTAGPGSVSISGWAIDADASTPTTVQFTVDDHGSVSTVAGADRPDLAGAFPGLGIAHGFTATISALAGGTHKVCAVATNQAAGTNTLLGCRSVLALSGNPIGSLDSASPAGVGSISIAGWALDPDTTSSIRVDVYVDGAGASVTASNARNDIGAAFPAYGAAHGFSYTANGLSGGTHTICAYGIDAAAPGTNSTLGCKTVTLPTGSPVGSLDSATTAGPAAIAIAGWALDPDTAASIPVAVYVDGSHFVDQLTASGTRSDIAAAYPGYGSLHGYTDVVTHLSPGAHTVCTYGINQPSGPGNATLGCKSVVVRAGAPFGSFDAAAASTTAGSGVVSGWAIDPDTASAISLSVTVNAGTPQILTAGVARADIAAAFPGYGANHGFSATVTGLVPGSNTVCVSALDSSGGPAVPVGCKTVTF